MNRQNHESETSRRDLLRLGTKVSVGVCSVGYLLPLGTGAEYAADQVPGHHAGNAGLNEDIVHDCEVKHPTDKKEECRDAVEKFNPSATDFVSMVVTGPPVEEAIFRGFPSLALDARFGEHTTEGKQTLGLSRREWVVGGITSLLFGTAHNFTKKGFSTTTIPAAQTVMGLGFWRLQRREGYAANTSAHMTLNGIAFVVAKAASHFRK